MEKQNLWHIRVNDGKMMIVLYFQLWKVNIWVNSTFKKPILSHSTLKFGVTFKLSFKKKLKGIEFIPFLRIKEWTFYCLLVPKSAVKESWSSHSHLVWRVSDKFWKDVKLVYVWVYFLLFPYHPHLGCQEGYHCWFTCRTLEKMEQNKMTTWIVDLSMQSGRKK